MTEQDVLDAARAIGPHLSELVGAEAGSVRQELDRLLQQAERGHAVKRDILRLFAAREPTREWARRLLEVPPELRSYEGVPGAVQRVVVPRYECPQGDAEPWYRFNAGEPVPLCAEHRIPLVRVR